SLANVVAVDDPGIIATPMPQTVPIVGSWLHEVLDKGQIVRRETLENLVEDQVLGSVGVAAALLVPFMADGKIEAAMSIQFERQHPFSDYDLKALHAVATHVGLALA